MGDPSSSNGTQPLWTPSKKRVAESRMTEFIGFINGKYNTSHGNYNDLYKWSIDNLPNFWAAMWDYADIRHSKIYDDVVAMFNTMPGTKWFPGSRLNFAENLLRFRDDSEALISLREDGLRQSLTFVELYAAVAKLAGALKEMGVEPGDRVAGYVANSHHAIIAMLAATSLGAIWTSCSPDFGAKGAKDRFSQTEPKVLVGVDGYHYGSKGFSIMDRIGKLVDEIDSIQQVIIIPYLESQPDLSVLATATNWDDIQNQRTETEIAFAQMPGDHPVYILYSSGTTNVPKCITHGAIGTLLQHYKELALHTNIRRESTVFYFTTCGWMMWNWLVSNLMLGSRIVLFDGSPFYPGPEILWEMAEKEGVTVFGTSARYLASLEDSGLKPGKDYDLSNLEVICSTGSPLAPESFRYVYRDIKQDLQLASISGGTDIVSCFMLGNPTLPVYEEEIQCIGLGMAVEAWDSDGHPVVGEKGELVCTKPAPSMPVCFWNDPDMEKYRDAYFSVYQNVWRHGDYIEITERGGIIMHGRSDTVLNPGGVRIGTAEIYKPLALIPEIADSIVIGQKWQGDERIILFVKLNEGAQLDDELIKRIRTTIRVNASPRHMPSKVIAVTDIPHTLTGKKVELAVRRVVHGEQIANLTALANPESLDCYKNLSELKE